MAFVKYNSIENTYQQRVLAAITDYGYDSGEWVVLEKAHGSNFSFIVTEDSVTCAKRTSILTDDELRTFYNAAEVAQRYNSAAKKLRELVGQDVIIYGELLGGGYGDLELPTKSTKIVQHGVYYCPQNDFYAFDVRVGKDYLDYDTCVELFQKTGFPHAGILFRGSLTEALQWSELHKADPTGISAQFGMEPLEGNIREGNVVKPLHCKFFLTGSRVILKDKNEHFSEKVHKPRHKPIVEDTPELTAAVNDALDYVTDARLDCVLSKDSLEINRKTLGRLTGLLTQDALKDWHKDYTGEPLKKELQKKLNKRVSAEARKILVARLTPQ